MTLFRATCLSLIALSVAPSIEAEAARRPSSRARDNGPVLPAIRIAADNRVPACATPESLMAFLMSRNDKLDSRYRAIAHDYRKHGDANGVRWDMAFIQMVLETNALKFRRGDGTPGDVKSHQNNFAGIGATGGGVPGERFPDVSTGVKAHIQHLVAYSGEMVAAPVATRTKDVQDGIVKQSLKLGRTVRYDDLTRRWAADRNYARSMQVLLARFQEDFCTARTETAAAPAPMRPPQAGGANVAAAVSAPVPARRAAQPLDCRVMTASYGGSTAMLIRTEAPGRVTYTALGVESGAEETQARSFIASHTAGGTIAGRFRSRNDAVVHAYSRCDTETR